MTKTICFIIVVLLSLGNVTGQFSNIRFKHLSTSNGLSHDNINDIVEDSNGYVWIATSDGLNRYDGNSFKVFRHHHTDTNSLSFNWIWDIHPLKNGNLLIGTRKGLDLFDTEKNQFRKIKPGAIKDELNINHIQTDKQENIWIATWGNGVFVLNRHFELLQHLNIKTQPALSSDKVGRIAIDMSENIWLGTWNGLDLYDVKKQTIKNYTAEKGSISGNKIISLVTDPNGGVWYGTSTKGYGYINHETYERKLYSSFPSGANVITSMVKDPNGYLWIGTYVHGLYVVNQNGSVISHHSNDKADPFSLPGNNIKSVYIDKQSNIWIGGEGISFYNKSFNQFGHIRTSSKSGLPNKSVWSFEEDNNGNIYIGSENGLSIFNPETGNFHNCQAGNSIHHFRIIYDMKFDGQSKIWLGTEQNYLIYYDIDKQKFAEIIPKAATIEDKLQEDINTLELRNDILWIGTYQKGLFRYHIQHNKIEKYKDPKIQSANWSYFYTDDKNNLWLCSIGEGIYVLNQSDSLIKHIIHSEKNENSITDNIVRCIHKSQNGAFWIGTSNGLNCYLPSRDTIFRYNEANGLPNNYICGILEDSRGDIWVSTYKGISKIELPEIRFKNFDYTDGLQSNIFHASSYLKSNQGIFFFGGKNGITYFNPSEIKPYLYRAKTNISGFYSQGIKENLFFPNQPVILDYDKNFFVIECMLSDYTNPEKISFEYKLFGIDKQWKHTSSNKIRYTRIPPGKYIFEVTGINHNNVKSDESAKLTIIIKRPWFFSVIMIFVYIFLLSAISYIIYKSVQKRKKLKADNRQIDIEKSKLVEIDQLRSELLSNISHEIRSPLSLILSPVEILRNKTSESKKTKLLNMIEWNANRLLFLVNQILDLSQIDANQLKLSISYFSLQDCLNPILNSYQSLASANNKVIRWNLPEQTIYFYGDKDKIEKIVVNLLSNAYKFSGDYSEIEFNLSTVNKGSEKFIKIKVSDNGIGINTEDMPHIFNRFYKTKTKNHDGVGIGLALTKQLVEMHEGEIAVESEPGKFTTFIVTIPLKTKKIVSEISQNGFKANNIFLYHPDKISEASENEPKEPATEQINKVLVVEDDKSLSDLISNLLSYKYQVIQASNGKEALMLLKKAKVNIIITDIAMPEMNGKVFIKKLKSEHASQNIPIIVLTARHELKEKLDFIQLGIDAFILKPFNNLELMARIDNIIESRKRIREELRDDRLLVKSKNLKITGDNELLINKIDGIIEENITNPQFSVEVLSEKLKMSRIQLHRKLKIITGNSASEYIRIYRLEKAAQYILSGKTKITQIAFEVGFNNPSYFSEQFKKVFDCNPSEYKNKVTGL
jgi:signal transduction histidine kinase/ligand-binding sensor domain-containing protein/DNA-binding response OmpR family regulator